MRELINKPAWVKEQYANERNLNARIALHKRFSTSEVEWTHWVLDQINAQLGNLAAQPVRLLELGAGPGTLWVENTGRLPAQWGLVLSDLSLGMAEAAQRNLAQAGVEASLLVASAEHIPIAAATCHAVVANHMLYHVLDRRRALEEICRVLLADGVLIAATNGEGHMRELHELAHRFDPGHPPEDPVPHKFSLESGQRELGEHFAEVTVLRTQNQLVVTEVEPLVAYMLSGSPMAISAEMEAKLRAFVQAEMAEHGSICISPETGLIIARGPRPA